MSEVKLVRNEILVYFTRPLLVGNRISVVLCFAVPLNRLYQIIRLDYSFQVFILNEASRCIFSPNMEDIGKEFANLDPAGSNSASVQFLQDILREKIGNGIFEKKDRSYWVSAALFLNCGGKMEKSSYSRIFPPS